jgi:RNA polymerase sigma-70 factor (sigma-E family)
MSGRDDEAFIAFVASSQRRLLQLAWLFTGDSHRAEELVQEALVRTYAVWHRVRADDPFGYTRRVLVNAKTDSWRRRSREDLVRDTPEPQVAGPDPSDAAADHASVVAALQTLAPRERAVVVLRYYVDLSEAETAHELRMSVGTVKSTASRALAKLRVQQADTFRLPTGPEGARR